jgi:hypothetical protein
LNAAFFGGLRLSLALGLSCSLEAGSGEVKTTVLGSEDLSRDEGSPENTPCPRASRARRSDDDPEGRPWAKRDL